MDSFTSEVQPPAFWNAAQQCIAPPQTVQQQTAKEPVQKPGTPPTPQPEQTAPSPPPLLAEKATKPGGVGANIGGGTTGGVMGPNEQKAQQVAQPATPPPAQQGQSGAQQAQPGTQDASKTATPPGPLQWQATEGPEREAARTGAKDLLLAATIITAIAESASPWMMVAHAVQVAAAGYLLADQGIGQGTYQLSYPPGLPAGVGPLLVPVDR